MTIAEAIWKYRETPSDLVPLQCDPTNFDTFEAARAEVRSGELARIVRETFFSTIANEPGFPDGHFTGTHETYEQVFASPEYYRGEEKSRFTMKLARAKELVHYFESVRHLGKLADHLPPENLTEAWTRTTCPLCLAKEFRGKGLTP